MADHLLSKDLITYDPLSETTRKERTSLLGLAMLGVALVKIPLVPKKFSALGVDFADINQARFVQLYALVIGYYVTAFAIYAVSDYVAWRRQEVITLHEYEQQNRERRASASVSLRKAEPEEAEPRNASRPLSYRGAAGYWVAFWVARSRAVFEFLMPIAFASYAMWVLLSYTAK